MTSALVPRRHVMARTVYATYDGEVLRPEEPLEFAPNTRVKMTIEGEAQGSVEPYASLRLMESLNLQGPPDMSERLHDYLYGTGNDARA
jgi:hypothetical protein